MNVVVVDTYKEIGEKAADIFVAQLLMKPNSILGLATGSTPLSLYEALIQRYKDGKIDFSQPCGESSCPSWTDNEEAYP